MKCYKLSYLTEQFYKKYNAAEYPEIENKSNRPYMVMLIQIKDNLFAIPFRTNVRHNNCYKFKKSTRPTGSITGLDYSKAVVITDKKFIGVDARINDKEYVELDQNHYVIIQKFKKYVEGYIVFATGKSNKYVAKNYKYTTLKYFHKELKIHL